MRAVPVRQLHAHGGNGGARHQEQPPLLAGLLTVALPTLAAAQPSTMPGGPPAGGEDEPKPKGIAEAAPKPTGLMATTVTLPPPTDRRKKFEVITIDGYLRARGDYLKNLHLGFSEIEDGGGSPFPQALPSDKGRHRPGTFPAQPSRRVRPD